MPQRRALPDWLRIDRKGPPSLHEQIGRQLRAAIKDGRLAPGTLVPSSRDLASQLGVARGTVAGAYDRLVSEGLLQVRSRTRTSVADVPPARVPPAIKTPSNRHVPRADPDSNPPPHAAFLPGIPAFDMFPAGRWARLLAGRTHQMSQELADNDFHMGGYGPLRSEIARHLQTARGIACSPDQVVITTSARAALSTVCQLLSKPGDRCIVEDPGYVIARRIMVDYGMHPVPMPVDAEGMNLDAGLPEARLAYVTPTYQMPMGVRLADHRCRKLIEWAEQHDAWIIEDDYDSEFRYAGEAIAALPNSPHGRVIHVGTFSKTMFPSLRVAYMVLPDSIAGQISVATYLHGREPALHVQAALSDFFAMGHYAAHIRRVRITCRRRQALLVDSLNEHLRGIVHLEKPSGGMHLILPLPAALPAKAVQSAAADAALHVRPISYYSALSPTFNGLQLGFAALNDRAIEPAASRLGQVIRSLRLD